MTCRARLLWTLVTALACVLPGRAAPASLSLRVVVTLRNLQPVTDLTQADFSLLSDGQPLRVISCAPASRAIHLVVLIDRTNSVSMTVGPAPSADAIEEAIKRSILPAIDPGDDVRIGAVGATNSMGPAFTADRAVLTTALHDALHRPDTDRYGPSPIWDAVWAATDALRTTPTDGRAILLLTDGRATGNVHGFGDALREALRSQTSVSVVAVGAWQPEVVTGSTTIGLVHPEAQMEQLVRASGGEFLPLTFADHDLTKALTTRFAQALTGWRAGYTLTFEGLADGQPHQIIVAVKRPGALIRAATLYVSGPG